MEAESAKQYFRDFSKEIESQIDSAVKSEEKIYHFRPSIRRTGVDQGKHVFCTSDVLQSLHD